MMKRSGFTLMELLVVVGIMGLLGTISVGGYRAMQRGMEERGVMQNVNEFTRSAYQRAQIDRTPVAVFFWNETLREENATGTQTPVVVGKAVAVRRYGRITSVSGEDLIDEFGDLRFSRLIVDEDNEDANDSSSSGGAGEDADGQYLYPMNGTRDGTSLNRSLVRSTTVQKTINPTLVMFGESTQGEVIAYAYHVLDRGNVSWSVGDAYGFEFAEMTLPHNYIFGTSFSQSVTQPVKEIDKKFYEVGASAEGIQVSSLRPGANGELSAQKIGTSDKPSQARN